LTGHLSAGRKGESNERARVCKAAVPLPDKLRPGGSFIHDLDACFSKKFFIARRRFQKKGIDRLARRINF